MRDDAALLVGGDDQRRQTRAAAPFLKRCNFGLQRLRRAAGEIVPGDVDTGDQPFFGEAGYLLEGRISHDEMPTERLRDRQFRMQHVVLADLEDDVCAQHRQRRETPQPDQQLFRNA